MNGVAQADVAGADHELLDAYRLMRTSRVFDAKAINLHRQGRLGTFSASSGQEAVSMGVALALNPAGDWLVPQYREFPALLRYGWDITTAILYYRGHPAGWEIPDRVLNLQIALGAQLPHATGLAWGLRQAGEDSVVAAFCGDGASSEGDFHEAVNFAGAMRLPVIFVVQNNGWAISTPVEKQTATESFALRAAGYGIEGAIVDGNDLLAMHAVAEAAVARARAGEGPTLIDARTYRLEAHNTVDDPRRYQDPETLKREKIRDPLERLRKHLMSRELLTAEADEALTSELQQLVDQAVAAADSQPAADPATIYEHVLAQPTSRLRTQQAEWLGQGSEASR